MSQYQKVKLPPDYIGICRSCRHSRVVMGAGKMYISCDTINFGGRDPDKVPFLVEECSVFDDKRLTSLGNMQTTAWILQSDEDKKYIGFVSAKEWRKDNRYRPVLVDDDD